MTTAAAFHRAWRQLPPGRLTDIVGDGTCLILAPHPDDESLGCGGLIAACIAAGRPPLRPDWAKVPVCEMTPRRTSTRCRLVAST